MTAFVGKRVLMLLENLPYQRDPRVKSEVNTLVMAGYKVTVICPRARRSERQKVLHENVHLYQFPELTLQSNFIGHLCEYGWSMLMIYAMSIVVWIKEGFDILHAHNPPDTFFPLAAFYKLVGKKFVYDHHDLSPELYDFRYGASETSVVHKLLVLFENLTCKLADHVIATNESYKAIEISRGGVSPHKITIVRNGPNLERVQIGKPDSGLRKKAKTILGYFGNIGPQDGVDYIIRALHHLVNDFKIDNVFCIVAGKGDALPGITRLVKKLELEEYVWVTGWLADEDFFRYMSTIDIALTPDPSNSFNDKCTMIKVMEYMALGKPIVAFDLPEHRVTAQSAALYATVNDERDFAKQIINLMKDAELRQSMGRIGRDRIETELAWSYQATRLVAAYSSLQGVVQKKHLPVSGGKS